jgi:hypothetical protein
MMRELLATNLDEGKWTWNGRDAVWVGESRDWALDATRGCTVMRTVGFGLGYGDGWNPHTPESRLARLTIPGLGSPRESLRPCVSAGVSDHAETYRRT